MKERNPDYEFLTTGNSVMLEFRDKMEDCYTNIHSLYHAHYHISHKEHGTYSEHDP
jgi:hypothetical protein